MEFMKFVKGLDVKGKRRVLEKLYAFCPTGEGGGIDNSCPPASASKEDAKQIGAKGAHMKWDTRVEIQTKWPGRPSAGFPIIRMKVPADRFSSVTDLDNYLKAKGLRKVGAHWEHDVKLSEKELDDLAAQHPERDVASDNVQSLFDEMLHDLRARKAV